jgi:transcriptional regulator with XRE-family HTH domain
MIQGSEFYKLRMEAGFNSWPKLAAFLGVTVRTVQNWEKSGVPPMVEKFLRLLAQDLSFLGKEWENWRIVAGEFVEYGGKGYSVSPGEMRAFVHMERQIGHMEYDIKRLTAELAAAKAQLRFQAVLDVSSRVDLP